MTGNDKNRPNLSHTFDKTKQSMVNVGSVRDVKISNSWDNGLYVTANIGNITVNFLLDSGATSSLISKDVFDRCSREQILTVQNDDVIVQGVDGKPLHIHGHTDMNLKLGSFNTTIRAIVSDIAIDGILGQDFILKHIRRWDLDTNELSTKCGQIIICHKGHVENRVCRIVVSEKRQVPANTFTMVSVQIPDATRLPETALVDEFEKNVKGNIKIVKGIIDPHTLIKYIGIINDSEEDITIKSGQDIGQCYPIFSELEAMEEVHKIHIESCAAMNENRSECIKPGQKAEDDSLPEHLREMFRKGSEDLDDAQKEKFATLINRYVDVFAKDSRDLGCTNLVKHKINTGNSQPIRQPVRRQPYGKREIEKEEIEKMLERGVIEPSNSPWSSPIVLVSKKDGSTRFCIDYRKLNEVTVQDAYPIPRVDDCLDALSGSKWFNTMDLCSGFWQIQMDEEDKLKTAFSTSSQGLFHFRVMPFGLVNAPPTFQRLMENVLRGIQWVESLLYMDDIITPGESVDQCLFRLEHVFQRLRTANLKLKPSKCIFFQKSAHFLGHIVSENGIETDPEKVKAVKEWPRPRNSKDVRSFLGLASYYRKFVKGFSEIAKPLHKLCEKNSRFSWTEACQTSFEALKQSLMSAPVLAYPKLGSRFILDTDSSDFASGAVLSQVQDGQERVIAYMSKSMNVHETSYCISRKEILAVVKALKHFHNYLYGQEILLRTDNAAVSWMRTLKVPTGQVARWLQELNTYNLKVVHRSGRSHANADALSRMPCKSCKRQQELQDAFEESKQPHENHKEVLRVVTRGQRRVNSSDLANSSVILDGWDPIDISTAQNKDVNIGRLKLHLQEGKERPSWADVSAGSSKLKTLWRQWDRLVIIGDLLFRKFETDEGEEINQLVTPSEKQQEILKYHHDIPTGAHLGFEKTLNRVRQAFYWPGVTESVRKYCRRCDVCTSMKLSRETNKAPLGQYYVGERMERVMMDILGPLPLTKNGNRYILVICDWFTKWTESIAIPDMETRTVARAFLDNFVCRFGVPLQIHTDQGRSFESQLIVDLCDLLGIEKTHATPLRPQSNGLVERQNRTLVAMLKPYCQSNQNVWDTYLQQVMLAYRSTPQSSTKISPNKMLYGHEVVLPVQAFTGRPCDQVEHKNIDVYVENLHEKLVSIHDLARQNLKSATMYQKRYYDTNAKRGTYKKGQLVWLYDPVRKVGISTKLVNKWKGPFVVTKVIDDLVCLVKRTSKGKSKAYHVDRLIPYHGRKVLSWAKKVLD